MFQYNDFNYSILHFYVVNVQFTYDPFSYIPLGVQYVFRAFELTSVSREYTVTSPTCMWGKKVVQLVYSFISDNQLN